MKNEKEADPAIPHRVEKLWLEDGNLILVAGNALYKVYRVPADSELIDGCPVVRLLDAEAEVTPFLEALFDPCFFLPPPAPTDFTTIYGCLRLSHKYDVEYLRQRALAHFNSAYATTLEGHQDGTFTLGCDLPLSKIFTWVEPEDESFIICAFQLAREVGAMWVLPVIFYDMASCFFRLGSRIFLGAEFEGIHAKISVEDQETLVAGFHEQLLQGGHIMRFLSHAEDVDGCTTPLACTRRRLTAMETIRVVAMAELSARHTSLSAGHDILIHILDTIVNSGVSWRSTARKRGTIRLVSSAWRDTLDLNPALWKHIDIAACMRPQYIDSLFLRAGATLKIVIVGLRTLRREPASRTSPTHHQYPRHPGFLPAVAQNIVTNAPTIQKLALKVNNTRDWNEFVVAVGSDIVFPALKALAVLAADYRQSTGPLLIHPLLGTLPVIKDIVFDDMSYRCLSAPSAYANLASLTLCGVAEEAAHERASETRSLGSMILDVLRGCSRLSCLRLSNVDLSRDRTMQPVELPTLRSFSYACTLTYADGDPLEDYHVCGRIASLLHTPYLRSMAIWICHEDGVVTFAAQNRPKLAVVTTLQLAGQWSHYGMVERPEWFLSKLHKVKQLDITQLDRVPLIDVLTERVPNDFDAYLFFILACVSLPAITTLRIPHSLTPLGRREFVDIQAEMQRLFLHCVRRAQVTIVEEHTNCDLRRNFLCERAWVHGECCTHGAFPEHQRCSPASPTTIYCTITDDHSNCAHSWSFDTQLQVHADTSSAPRGLPRPVDAVGAYRVLFS
ncbi:hypothetical protein C8F01DRAFT_1252346 [Mycena amicta]|nr:hypothetical protein C8F01DRAFT_1252346 [Mycena amicta]